MIVGIRFPHSGQQNPVFGVIESKHMVHNDSNLSDLFVNFRQTEQREGKSASMTSLYSIYFIVEK